ncbi:sphinganine kinase lcb4 [Orbilia oligospora]|uniref:Sphinganine kinase lcb4 n=1 Tax=Orbilia oligospora TaxID=2813651 RepID=A0A7C8K1W7_ORBOL|nr:sphinganine kinase lcb4 [Orbilia oligospora]KAF3188361.1 sphinganine kinase lcb4 [Orbilia oligospora]KAF3240285.1 sphinganine kinase lcb4 [Orbilia oligospora]KAF3258511.1 sphinganine kinase lcb4 [Orbilia oligospora]KAF3281339.1 sphinganine kinase lcb4 [Orbilia oligospora]
MSSEHQGLVTSTSHDGVAISPEDALLLDTHSLIIREDRVTIADKRKSSKKRDASCCGIAGTGKPSDELVTLHNILWARVYISEDKSAVQITSAKELSSRLVKPSTTSIPIDDGDLEKADRWVERLLEKAYEGSQQAKRFKVLINPHGGPGTAEKIYKTEIEPIFTAASCHIDVEHTEYSQHAIKIAQELDIEAYDAVVCISGDGVPHEVFNGLARRPDARKALNKIAVCQLPGGSGNGMCWSFTGTDAPSLAAVALVKGKRTPFDLVSVTQGDKRILSFLSQSVGLTAELDLGTENMRWMGNTRFTVGFLQRVITERIYPSEIHVKLAIESKEEIRRNASTVRLPPDGEHEYEGLPPLQYGTVNDPVPDDWVAESHPKMGNFYCGNMICMSKDIHFFPAAKPNDGHMDLATMDGDVGRLKAVGVMLGAETGKHFDIPELSYRKVLAYRFTPKNQKDGYISIDGEKVAFAPFQAEIHHGLGVSLSLRPNVYEGPTLV